MTENAARPVTAVFLFRFSSAAHRWWAFKQMRLGRKFLEADPRVSFFKLLGTGGGRGFSWWPDFGSYVVLTTFPDESALAEFARHNPLMKLYHEKSSEQLELHLRAFRAHGQWGGVQPFENQNGNQDPDLVAVLTRASIRTQKLPEFWRHVPGLSREIQKRDGLLLAKGIGEIPLAEQATFSLWRSSEAMQSFAYRDDKHAQVVQKTRSRHWYSEELFARFEVLCAKGSWQGQAFSYGLHHS